MFVCFSFSFVVGGCDFFVVRLPHQATKKNIFRNFKLSQNPTTPHHNHQLLVINNNSATTTLIKYLFIPETEAPVVMTLPELSALIAALPESPEVTWGPPATIDSALNDVPYAPYSKGDKLGRMADWSTESGKDGRDQRGGRQGYNRNYRGFSTPRTQMMRI